MSTAVNSNWAYAVPLNGSNGYTSPVEDKSMTMSETRSSVMKDGPQQVARRRTSDYDIRGEADSRRRRTPSKSSNTASRKRSKNTLREKSIAPEGNTEDSAWIHRDKLAAIEIREMQEAGFHVRHISRSSSTGAGRESRSASRAQTVDQEAYDSASDVRYDPAYTSFDDFQRKRISTIHGDDEAEDDYNYSANKDGSPSSQPKSPTRPGTSRIPLAKSSPAPIPQNSVERDSLLPRSRSNSATLTSWEDAQHARRTRSDSNGGNTFQRDSSESLRQGKGMNGRKVTPPNKKPEARSASGARKTSTSNHRTTDSNNGRPSSAQKKPRQMSSNGRRPTSSSSTSSRPTSHHFRAPEGDPPWLATMFKPDPRLPPDQQMLPTHAKRAMQEQWAAEGRTGNIYGKDLELISADHLKKPLPTAPQQDGKLRLDIDRERIGRSSPMLSPTGSMSPEKVREDGRGARSDAASVRSGRGLRITPTIDAPASPRPSGALHPPFQSTITTIPMPSPEQLKSSRMPELDEKLEAKQKKGICCVVM